MPHTGAGRVAVMHKNIPNMLSQITQAFSSKGVNIENLANGSKGDMAYTIVEIADAPSQDFVYAVSAIDGVIKVKTYKFPYEK